MICPNCHASHLLTHPEERFAERKWLKCNLCGYSQPEGGFPKPLTKEETNAVLERLYEEDQELMDRLED